MALCGEWSGVVVTVLFVGVSVICESVRLLWFVVVGVVICESVRLLCKCANVVVESKRERFSACEVVRECE